MLRWLLVVLGVGCSVWGWGAEQEALVYADMPPALQALGGDSVLRYDALKLVASLQGVVNREKPRLLLRFLDGQGAQGRINVDDYWLEKMQAGWLKDREVARVASLEAVLERFKKDITGWILWDPLVPATANVAATVCGVEGWLPVRADGALWKRLQALLPDVPVKLTLTNQFPGVETGSAKCDAYLWAKRTYLDTGKCNPALMAYYVDAFTQAPNQPGMVYPDLPNSGLTNHDYYISQRAFFFDLNVWTDEATVDEPRQIPGTDRRILIDLLKSQAARNEGKQFTSVGGFIPWNQKYTNSGAAGGKHEPVASEWEYASILSAHNAIMDADALGLVCMANASAYRHYPLETVYKQNPRPAKPALEKKTYVLVYMGDYDSAAWLSSTMPSLWDDPARGKLPIAWAFNPNLSDRAPYVFDLMYKTKTPNDWFIGGDSGAGYLNPNLLTGDRLKSGLPDALDLWVKHNQKYYQRFDYDITGFAINGYHGDMPLRVQEAYTQFSPVGVGMQLGFAQPIVNGTPFVRHNSDIYPKLDQLDVTAAEMRRFAKPETPQFLIFRWILQRPSTLLAVRDLLQQQSPECQWEFCDPYTFFALYKEWAQRPQ